MALPDIGDPDPPTIFYSFPTAVRLVEHCQHLDQWEEFVQEWDDDGRYKVGAQLSQIVDCVTCDDYPKVGIHLGEIPDPPLPPSIQFIFDELLFDRLVLWGDLHPNDPVKHRHPGYLEYFPSLPFDTDQLHPEEEWINLMPHSSTGFLNFQTGAFSPLYGQEVVTLFGKIEFDSRLMATFTPSERINQVIQGHEPDSQWVEPDQTRLKQPSQQTSSTPKTEPPSNESVSREERRPPGRPGLDYEWMKKRLLELEETEDLPPFESGWRTRVAEILLDKYMTEYKGAKPRKTPQASTIRDKMCGDFDALQKRDEERYGSR